MAPHNRHSASESTKDDIYTPLLYKQPQSATTALQLKTHIPLRRHAHRIEATRKQNRFKSIYFAPENIQGSKIVFGPPSVSPNVSPDTPGIKELPQYRAEPTNVKYDASMSQQDLSCPSQEEMDYVVDQLARSDLMPTLRGVRYSEDYSGDYSSSESDRCDSATLPSTSCSVSYLSPPHHTTTPSLCSASTRSSNTSLPGASLVNYTGTIDDIKRLSNISTPNYEASEPKLRLSQGEHRAPYLPLPPLFRSIALTDPKVHGQPIRYTSSTYEPGSNVLKVGSCTFLNLPYGENVECGLRTEPNPSLLQKNNNRTDSVVSLNPRNQQVRLQIVQRVVHAKTGRQAILLCAETDVSEGFTYAVRAELASRFDRPANANLKMPNGDILPPTAFELEGDTLVPSSAPELLSPTIYQPKPKLSTKSKPPHFSTCDQDPTEDIWLNIARSLSTPEPSKNPLPAHNKPFDQPSPALKDLFSLLDEIKLLHRNFFVIRMTNTSPARPSCEDVRGYQEMLYPPRPREACAKTTRFSILWLSTQLFQILSTRQADVDAGMLGAAEQECDIPVVRSFSDAMAFQLSPDISPVVVGRDAATRKAGAFFKQVQLPRMVAGSSRSGKIKQLASDMGVYAVPMFDDAIDGGVGKGKGEVKCWMCFLVDKELKDLWG